MIAIAAEVLQVGDPPDILRRFLDRHQVGLVGQLDKHLGRDVHRIRHRVVVDHDRQAGRPRDGTEVGDRLARVGLVNHRRQDHQAVDTELLCVRREPARERGRILGDPAQDRHPPADMLDRRTQDFELFFVQERAVLADRAQHDQPVDAGLDHLADMGHRRRKIERLVRLKLSRGRRKHTLPRNAHLLAPHGLCWRYGFLSWYSSRRV